MYLGELIYNLSIEMNKQIELLFKPMNLRVSQVHTLLHVYDIYYRMGEEVIALDALNQRMYIDKSNVSRNIRKLEEEGYLIRRSHHEGSSQKVILLTEKGKAFSDILFGELQKMSDQMTTDVSPEEMKETERLLSHFMNNMTRRQ